MPGSTLVVDVDTRRPDDKVDAQAAMKAGGTPEGAGLVPIYFAYMRSYTNMGRASFE